MARHLTAILFGSHGSAWPAAGEPDALRIDHVLLDADDGVVAMLAFEAMGRVRQSCELALIAAAREAAGPDAREDLHYLQSVAAASGVHFARPGAAPAAALHRRRFARPDRLLLSAVPGAGGAGAFAMLAFPAGPLEAAAALAGIALARPRPRVCGVHLVGSLCDGAGAAELLAALERALEHETRDAVLECHGDGVASVPMAIRIAFAALAPVRLGALAVIWPSDEVTRAHLRVCGRESDWRRLEGDGHGFERAVSLALDTLAPLTMETLASRTMETLASLTPPAPHATMHVRLGASAEDDDVREWASLLRGRTCARGVTFEVIAGGRAARTAVADALASLEACGAVVRDPAEAGALAPLPDGALACCDEVEVAAGRARVVSAASGASAVTGIAVAVLLAERVTDAWAPGAGAVKRVVTSQTRRAGEGGEIAAGPAPRPGAGALEPGEVLEPRSPGESAPIEHGPAHKVPRVPPAFTGPLRGTVVLAAGDDAHAGRLVPWGPRAQAARGDALALVATAFRDLDEKAAERVLAERGGFVVAGRGFGGGPRSETAARVLAAAGVRIVLADTYDREQERLLALHGVLPLHYRRADDAAALAAGDTLEIAGLPEALAPEKRVAIRDLTAGRTFLVEHALAPHLLDLVRAGGLLGLVVRAQAPVGGSTS